MLTYFGGDAIRISLCAINDRLRVDLLSVRVIGSDQEINNELASIAASNNPVVVFLHGYNNSFSDALRRAATIKNDIAGDGTVISYTWPSDGSVLGYGYDASSAGTASQIFNRSWIS